MVKRLIPKLRLIINEDLPDIDCGDRKIIAELTKILAKLAGGRHKFFPKTGIIDRSTFPQIDFPNLTFKVMYARKLFSKKNLEEYSLMLPALVCWFGMMRLEVEVCEPKILSYCLIYRLEKTPRVYPMDFYNEFPVGSKIFVLHAL